MQNESTIVSSILSGDTGSFETLMSLYKNRIYSFLLKMSFSREDAEDMTQEVFIRVYNSLYQYNSKWCFSTWIFKIAVNVFNSEYSKKKNRDSKKFADVIYNSTAFNTESPEEALENMETKMEILRMLDSLKLDQKTALVLKYVQGFSYKEIGEILKMSPENAKVRVMRAKKALVNANLKP